MTSLDDLPFHDPDWPPEPAVEREPRKCRRHEWWMPPIVGPDAAKWDFGAHGFVCRRCGKVKDEALARRGKNSRYRGKRIERVEMRAAGVHTGNANKADDGQSVDGMFAYQVKSRATSLFPGWQSAELDKLRTAHAGKIPVLTVIEAPGPGRKPRKLAVIEWRDWLDLHGDAK